MNSILNSVFNKMNFVLTFLVLYNANAYVIGNKVAKGTNGGANIAYSQDNKGSYQFAYEVTDKGGATNFRQETGGPKAVKGSYGLTDTDGRTRLVNYQADKFGFVATVDTNEPGTGREDAANAAYNGPDKGKGWAYAVQLQEDVNKPASKFEGTTYQSYSYTNNFDDAKFNNQNNNHDNSPNNHNNEQPYNEKNYDRRDEYKNPVEVKKPVLNQKQKTTDTQPPKKKDDNLIKNVNYESGGHFDASNSPSNGETDKNYDQLNNSKTLVDDTSDNLDDKSEEEPYEKRQMHLISHPKTTKSDYLTTIDKLAKKEKAKPLKITSKKSNSKSDKVISKLISLSSSFEDGKWKSDK